MKKTISIVVLSFLIAGSIFSAPKKSLDLSPIEFNLPSAEGKEFNYVIDPRVEVVGTICRLAGDQMFTQNYGGNNAFLSQMDTLFEKYKDHKAVKAVQNYRNQKKINGDAWLNLAYHIKPDFSGTIVEFNPYPEDLNPDLRKISSKDLLKMVSLFHDFAVDTNFQRICILNQGSYVSDLNWMKEDLEKASIHTWGKDFFNQQEVDNITITVSRLCVGSCFYDFMTGPDGIRKYALTIYPGIYYSTITQNYSLIYTQLYANRNWEEVKETFTRYIKDFAKKTNPENAKEIDKEEIYSNQLAAVLSNYCYLDYCSFKAGIQDEEDIQKNGDYSQYYDSIQQYLEKAFGNDATNAISLLNEYKNDREKYPNFIAFDKKLNDYVNTLKVE